MSMAYAPVKVCPIPTFPSSDSCAALIKASSAVSRSFHTMHTRRKGGKNIIQRVARSVRSCQLRREFPKMTLLARVSRSL